MTHRRSAVLAACAITLALGGTGASAAMMHSKLGARLAGMGDHGTVNLTVSAGKVCWSFDLPMVANVTRASIHAGSRSTMLFELGMHYAKAGCATEPAMTTEHLETTPAAYTVWVDTKGHPGDLRGKLFAGMAAM